MILSNHYLVINWLDKILLNQRQYSDKDIFINLNAELVKILNEKINLGQKDIIHFVVLRNRYRFYAYNENMQIREDLNKNKI